MFLLSGEIELRMALGMWWELVEMNCVGVARTDGLRSLVPRDPTVLMQSV
jgi:hypothetical protein